MQPRDGDQVLSLDLRDIEIAVGGASEVGGRETNEDAYVVRPLPGDGETGDAGYLIAVADGMGGYQGGDVASRTAIDLLADLFARETPRDVAAALKQAFRRANEVIYQRSQEDSGNGPMGTTLVAAVIQGKYATVANVGDSRAYLIRANQLTQVTQDHSLVAEQVTQGALSADDARRSPQRNILTHALGHREQLDRKMPGIFEITLLPEDRLLLCSDGFYDVLQPDDYLRALESSDAAGAATALARLAVERGTSDNVTAVVAAVMPSRATVQREVIAADIASRRPSLVVPILISLFILIIAALAVAFFLL